MSNLLEVVSGLRIGRLVVGEKILPTDPKVIASLTPHGYIAHGSLRECQCDCGEICYISEYALRRSKSKSCGCLRLGMRQRRFAKNATKATLAAVKREIKDLVRKYHLARLKGNGDEESRVYSLITEAKKREKVMTLEIKS